MKATILMMVLLSAGCALGPLKVTHKEGNVPKVHLDLPTDDCKINVRLRLSKHKQAKLDCTWRF